MPAYAELELTLRRRAKEGQYSVDLRYNLPNSDADIVPLRAGEGDFDLDFDSLAAQGDKQLYGGMLSSALFSGRAGEEFSRIRSLVESQDEDTVLRVRLTIDSSAPELHTIHWETVRDPERDGPLVASEKIAFSRYFSSMDWRPVKTRPRASLRALVVVANPSDLDQYGPEDHLLAPVDVKGETERALAALRPLKEVQTLLSPSAATLDNTIERLRDGFDILYLVCHGALIEKRRTSPGEVPSFEPKLALEGRDGKVEMASGSELARLMQDLPIRPRLVVLASCQSAGTGRDEDAAKIASAVGPQLAKIGIPAVVAMRGYITMDTIKTFMPKFFAELAKHGQIDQAMSVARRTVEDHSDYWMPVLYMRLKNGRVWYNAGFTGSQKLEQLKSICDFARQGNILPIIGPDFADHILGSSRELAAEIAAAEGFPFSAYDRSDPAKVMQALLMRSSWQSARTTASQAQVDRLRRKTADLFGSVPNGSGDEALWEKIAAKLYDDENSPYRILANLNARYYISATADPLLSLVLRLAKKRPVELVCQWRDERKTTSGEQDIDEDPTLEQPLLYYVYGKTSREDSLVLTEDDFWDYLIRVSSFKQIMPGAVSEALVTKSLLFLGFSMDDWKFRILFRMIMAKGGRDLLRKWNHVGVQLNPDETSMADADRAKRYLVRYFGETKIDIYWGTAGDFLREMKDEFAKSGG